MNNHKQRIQQLHTALKERILIIDGAMGTMIQTYELKETDYRGERLADYTTDVKGNNDLLSLSCPDIIRKIHDDFLHVGADIISINTFNATSIAQDDYKLGSLARELTLSRQKSHAK